MVITPARTQRYRILGRERDALYLPLKGGGRQHLLRFEANAVGWGSGAGRSGWCHRGRELTHTRLPPTKSGGRRPPPFRGRYCGACCAAASEKGDVIP